jgi:hypothetical protein
MAIQPCARRLSRPFTHELARLLSYGFTSTVIRDGISLE